VPLFKESVDEIAANKPSSAGDKCLHPSVAPSRQSGALNF
jgi:hypothetical protein